MEAKSIQGYIYLGFVVRYLQDVTTGVPAHGPGYIIANITALIKSLENNGLVVTKRSCKDLITFKNRVKRTKKEYALSDSDEKELRELIVSIKSTLTAEASGKFVYFVTEKRYPINTLLYSPESLFSKDTFSNLPELAKYDISQGCRCIAFNLPTSAAYHLLRATECVLRKLYRSEIEEKDRIKDQMWGNMVDHLQRVRKGDAPKKVILDHLKNIKDSFRNPTQHPDMRYDIDEVQDLLNLCIDVINRMQKYSNKTK